MIINDTKALFFPAHLRCLWCDGRGKVTHSAPKDYIWIPCEYCNGNGVPPIPMCEFWLR